MLSLACVMCCGDMCQLCLAAHHTPRHHALPPPTLLLTHRNNEALREVMMRVESRIDSGKLRMMSMVSWGVLCERWTRGCGNKSVEPGCEGWSS